MMSSGLRSRDRQRLRAEADAAVAGLPLPYLLEAVGKRLEVSDGRFEVRLRDGFLQDVVRRRRSYETCLPDGRSFAMVGDEWFGPDGLWERPFRAARKVGRPARRN